MQGAANVLKVQLVFALRMGEAVAVRFRDVTRVLGISSSVQPTVVASDANLTDAINQLLEDRDYVRLMEVGADASSLVVTSQPSLRQSSASNTVVARSALMKAAEKSPEVVHNIVLRTEAGFAAN